MPSDQTPNFFQSGVSNPAFEAEKPFSIGAGAMNGAAVSISAPASVANGATPITFTVSVPAGNFYAVEVATDASLFNNSINGIQRDDNNFYASWKILPFRQGSSFTLPVEVWNRLRQAPRLYYRVWSTASPNSWVSAQASVSDSQAASAPSVAQTAAGQSTGPGVPSITAPSSFPAEGPPPRFQVNPGNGRYYAVEVSTNSWYFTSQYSAQRNDDNFYGSWKMAPFASSAIYPATFELPQAAWDRLRMNAAHGRLFYRMWWTEAPSQWVNHGCTTPDSTGQNAPSFSLARSAEAGLPDGALRNTWTSPQGASQSQARIN